MKPSTLLRFGLLAFSATACVSVHTALQTGLATPITQRLPLMEVELNATILTKIDGTLSEELLPVFQREMRNNIVEPVDTATFGYARLEVTQAEVKRTGRALQMFQMLTLLAPSVLGIPLETYKTDLTAELEIVDKQGQVLGRYTGKGLSKVRVAMYYGYSQQAAPMLSHALALRQALGQIRPQLDSAATRLRPLLLKVPTDSLSVPDAQPIATSSGSESR